MIPLPHTCEQPISMARKRQVVGRPGQAKGNGNHHRHRATQSNEQGMQVKYRGKVVEERETSSNGSLEGGSLGGGSIEGMASKDAKGRSLGRQLRRKKCAINMLRRMQF